MFHFPTRWQNFFPLQIFSKAFQNWGKLQDRRFQVMKFETALVSKSLIGNHTTRVVVWLSLLWFFRRESKSQRFPCYINMFSSARCLVGFLWECDKAFLGKATEFCIRFLSRWVFPFFFFLFFSQYSHIILMLRESYLLWHLQIQEVGRGFPVLFASLTPLDFFFVSCRLILKDGSGLGISTPFRFSYFFFFKRNSHVKLNNFPNTYRL